MCKLSKPQAIILLMGMLMLVMLIHFGVVLQLIPSDMVWAGRIDSIDEMYVFESFSLLVNATLFAVLYIKLKQLKHKVSSRIIDAILWVYLAIFGLNSIGNLFASTRFEMLFGSLFALTAMYLCWVIVKKALPQLQIKLCSRVSNFLLHN